MAESFISRFTPSLMTPEEAEAIFVQRDGAAKELVGHILSHARSHNEGHLLYVGGPGLGKTHFLAVVHRRLHTHREAGTKLLTAWLREEHWALTTHGDLLLSILRALEREPAGGTLTDPLQQLQGLSALDLAESADELMRGYLGDRRLLVILEDVDQVFSVFSQADLKAFRAFLAANPNVLFLATAQSVPECTQSAKGALKGVFTTQHLRELTADEASELLLRIAALLKDDKLRALVRSPGGQAYIRAVHHVAGGVHRTYVVLAHHLSDSAIKAPMDSVLRTLDELKPFHQAYLARLSAQQRKIFQILCEARHPVPVKDIAAAGHMTHQTTSGQLKTLRHLDYVHSIPVGRESYYECSLPLVRFGIELARHRAEDLSRFLRFLRVWYCQTDGDAELPMPDPFGALRRDFLLPSLMLSRQALEALHVAALMKDFVSYAEWGDTARALDLAETLVRKRGRPWDRFAKVHCQMQFGRWEECLDDLDVILKRGAKNSLAWAAKGFCLGHLERYPEAVGAYDHALDLGLKRFEQIYSYRAAVFIRMGEFDDAVVSCRKAIDATGSHPLPEYLRALAETHRGASVEALAGAERALEEDDRYPEALRLQGLVLFRQGRYKEAVLALDRALSLHLEDALAWTYRGMALAGQGQMDEAAVSFERTVRLGTLNPIVLAAYSHTLMALGRWEEALAPLEAALERTPDITGPLVESTAAFVHALFEHALPERAPDQDTLSTQAHALLQLYARQGKTEVLGVALVRTLRAVRAAKKNAPHLQTWRATWLELASTAQDRPNDHEHAGARIHPEANDALTLPLRFLDTAIRYHQTQDLRHLLKLPVEERKLVVPLIAKKRTAKRGESGK